MPLNYVFYSNYKRLSHQIDFVAGTFCTAETTRFVVALCRFMGVRPSTGAAAPQGHSGRSATTRIRSAVRDCTKRRPAEHFLALTGLPLRRDNFVGLPNAATRWAAGLRHGYIYSRYQRQRIAPVRRYRRAS